MVSSELLRHCKEDFDLHLPLYQKMFNYYENNTDAKANYKIISSRSNEFADNNFIQKFIVEEANYCCLNKITYSSYNNDNNITSVIRNAFKVWPEGYNKDLLKTALIFQSAAELYYIDDNGNFKGLICNPLNSYVLKDDYGDIQLFIRFYRKKFDDTKQLYADVYSDIDITHYKVMGTDFIQMPNSQIDPNVFSRVPVGIVDIGDISESLYCRLKGLQDCYTTNLSDQTNINSDLRTKYLHFKNCQPTEDQLNDMKKNATITTTGADSDVEWLQSNEVSFKDTLNELRDQIYQQADHINFNAPLQSNTSSLAIEGTMIGLDQKVGDNISAISECIKTRLQFLFEYLQKKTGVTYDWKDVDIQITKNLPHDNLQAAQIASQSKGILPVKEALKLFSFVDNPDNVYSELQQENQANSVGADLLGASGGGA